MYCGDEFFCDEYEEMVMKTASDLSFKKREFEKDFIEAVKDGYFVITRRENWKVPLSDIDRFVGEIIRFIEDYRKNP